MHRADAVSERMSVADGRGNVGFGQQNGFGQAASLGKMAGNGCGESASGPVRGVGLETRRFEDLLFDTFFRAEAEQAVSRSALKDATQPGRRGPADIRECSSIGRTDRLR